MTGVMSRTWAWVVCGVLFVTCLLFAVIPSWPSAEFQNALLEDATIAKPVLPDVARTEDVPAGSPDEDLPSDEPVVRLVTAGDSSMMFMNAAIAEALPGQWVPVPPSFAEWTSGTGGLDRNGCGATGDAIEFYYNAEIGPRATRFNHAPEPESTCDWSRWFPDAIELSEANVLVVSFGPSSMWGYRVADRIVDLTDPDLRAIMSEAHRDFASAARSRGVERIIWAAYPPVVNRKVAETSSLPQYSENPAVSDAYFDLLSELEGAVLDLRDLRDPTLWRDGTHLNDEGARVVARRLLDVLASNT